MFFKRALVLFFLGVSGVAHAADSAVALMYHRFGEDKYPSTNIRLEQFEAHVRELSLSAYTVWPLPRLVAALRSGEDIPERTVAITVDDAFLSVYREAFPRLKAAGMPFTLFVNPASIDEGGSDFMTWDQVREMQAAGVTIGNHSNTHLNMADADPATNRADMDAATARFVAELGFAPDLFSYPYGELSADVIKVVAEAGMIAAFGQHSGAMGRAMDPYYLPRFSLNESYGEFGRFKTAINSLALPASDIAPTDIKLTRNPPAYGFTVAESVGSLTGLTCYVSHLGQVAPTLIGRRVEVRFTEPFPKGRGRINCTLPRADGRWYWRGVEFTVR